MCSLLSPQRRVSLCWRACLGYANEHGNMTVCSSQHEMVVRDLIALCPKLQLAVQPSRLGLFPLMTCHLLVESQQLKSCNPPHIWNESAEASAAAHSLSQALKLDLMMICFIESEELPLGSPLPDTWPAACHMHAAVHACVQSSMPVQQSIAQRSALCFQHFTFTQQPWKCQALRCIFGSNIYTMAP